MSAAAQLNSALSAGTRSSVRSVEAAWRPVHAPGTKRRRYLEENVGAAAVSLSLGEISALDAALAPERVAGPRYGETQMAQVDR